MILWLAFFLIPETVIAQRAFITTVNKQNRNYLILPSHTSAATTTNLPLVIILHRNGMKAASSFRSDAFWKQLKTPLILLFPSAHNDHWGCAEGEGLENDIVFLQALLEDTYENFHIDRNKIVIVNESDEQCLTEKFDLRYPHRFASIVKHSTSLMDDALITEIEKRVNGVSPHSSERVYELWQNPLFNAANRKKEMEDSIKRVRWEKRITVEFRTGGFYMLHSVKTEKDKTYMDLSDAHSLLDLHITSWMSDSIAWFVDVGWLRVPQKQEINGARIEAGGGAVVPITIGFKYALHRSKVRPYFLLGTGPSPVLVFGGRFSATSDPRNIKNKIKAEVRFALQTTIGTGIDCRLGKRILFGGSFRYIHSSEFESAGSVNAIRGVSASISAGYILGANRLNR